MSSRLSDTNPYLRNAAARERSVLRSVATSSAVEGIHAPFKQQNLKAIGEKVATKRADNIKR